MDTELSEAQNDFRRVERVVGTVISVNKTLCSFKLKINDGIAQIHSALAKINIPDCRTRVVIKNVYQRSVHNDPFNRANYYLDKQWAHSTDLRILPPNYSNRNKNRASTYNSKLYYLARAMQWGLKELAIFTERQLKFGPHIFADTLDEINVGLIEFLYNTERKLEDVVFTLPSSIQYIKSDVDYIKDSGTNFSHGVHHSGVNEVLIGCFRPNKNCFFELADGFSSRLLKVHALCNFGLMHFINKMVCITKFTVITEMFEDGLNLQYVLCNMEDFVGLDIHVLPKKYKAVNLMEEVPDRQFAEVFVMKILNIGVPNSTPIQTVECWMRVLINWNETWDECCLCFFGKEHFLTIPLLDIGPWYKIHLQNKLIPFTDPEISRISDPKNCFKVNGTCIFVPEETKQDLLHQPILSLKEVKDAIEKKVKGCVNFEGVVTLKYMCKDEECSRTQREIISKMFGTPGKMRHVLRFENYLENVKITLFLNNWERKQCPIGCVPWIRLIIRDAVICNSYLKSTGLTTFEVVGYEAPFPFNTVNLNPKSNREFYGVLGTGTFIPYNVTIRAKIMQMKLRSFKLKYEEEEMKLDSTFYTTDMNMDAFVFCSNMDFIKKLFFKTNKEFNRLINLMRVIHLFDVYEVPDSNLSEEHQLFYNTFSALIKYLFEDDENTSILIDWELTRVESMNKDEDIGVPSWMCKHINSIRILG